MERPFQRVAQEAVKLLKNDKENLIKEVIGQLGFDVDNVGEHFCRKIYPDGDEVFEYDGKPLLLFKPMEMRSHCENSGNKITFTQKVVRL